MEGGELEVAGTNGHAPVQAVSTPGTSAAA
jgi:hypothetical protein